MDGPIEKRRKLKSREGTSLSPAEKEGILAESILKQSEMTRHQTDLRAIFFLPSKLHNSILPELPKIISVKAYKGFLD